MKTFVHSSVDGVVKSTRLATAQAHIGNRTLVRSLASGGELLLCLLSFRIIFRAIGPLVSFYLFLL